MAPDPSGEAAQAVAEVWAQVARAGVEWGEIALGLALVATVFALIVVPGCPIKQEHPATI